MGIYYFEGSKIDENKSEAARFSVWRRKGVALMLTVDLASGIITVTEYGAIVTLGWCYQSGVGVTQDCKEAVRW